MAANAVGHLQFNIAAENVGFYRSLMQHLGLDPMMDGEGYLAVMAGNGVSLWFIGSEAEGVQDVDHRGVNHIALSADSVEAVDATVAFLPEIAAEPLWETPRRRPDFIGDGANDYYQVMFSSPDGIQFEVVYTGPLAEA